MPIYAYKCPDCGADRDAFNSIDERHTSAPNCATCAVQMTMVISPVRGTVKQDCHYVCPKTGQKVTSWAQRQNIFAEHGLVDGRDVTPAFIFEKKRREREELRREAAALDIPDVDLTPYKPSVEERLDMAAESSH